MSTDDTNSLKGIRVLRLFLRYCLELEHASELSLIVHPFNKKIDLILKEKQQNTL